MSSYHVKLVFWLAVFLFLAAGIFGQTLTPAGTGMVTGGPEHYSYKWLQSSGGTGTVSGPSKYQPTEIQRLRLEVKQKDAIIAQQALQQAQQNYQTVRAALDAEGAKVRAENKWPEDLQFDGATLAFTEPAKGEKK